MQQFSNLGDIRQTAFCAYCAGDTLTRDHVPSRVLLDEPYPENLPAVPSCQPCNVGFSADEEYLACLIECAVVGSTVPGDMRRTKIRRILSARPALATRLTMASSKKGDGIEFMIEDQRVGNVIRKLARGHALFELNEPRHREPSALQYIPLHLLSDEDRAAFETAPETNLFPEVGSRAMQRGIYDGSMAFSSQWVSVQQGRYRYLAHAGAGITIRIVLSEYLACEVIWDF